jgi:hypothetical protein
MYCFILNIISQINPVQKLYEYQVFYSDILLSLQIRSKKGHFLLQVVSKIKITVVPNDSQVHKSTLYSILYTLYCCFDIKFPTFF